MCLHYSVAPISELTSSQPKSMLRHGQKRRRERQAISSAAKGLAMPLAWLLAAAGERTERATVRKEESTLGTGSPNDLFWQTQLQLVVRLFLGLWDHGTTHLQWRKNRY